MSNSPVLTPVAPTLTLNDVTVDDCPWFGFAEGAVIESRVISVYDGDTVTLIVPFESKFFKSKCRLMGIDTPELRTKDPREKAAGYAARDYLRSLIADKHVWVQCGGYDKYGRLLGTLYLTPSLDAPSVNERMTAEGHARSYFGGTKEAFEAD
jgi:endonuclease YncB( thermonuclease family)